MKERLSGLGRRLVAYAVIVAAAILILRLVVGVVMGFVHMLIIVALIVFALFAIIWANRFRRSGET